ncbi:MAG TPA: Fe2+-dependent dioxygenase [Thiotrichales bacterium]|nr:Fe2+-dependent dioxygenase [Thiotrichales bacterium]
MKVIPLLDEAQLAQINSFIQTLSFTNGQATAQGVAKQLKQNEQILENDVQAKPLFDQLKTLIQRHPFVTVYAYPKTLVGLRIAKYENGGHYGWHVDMAHMAGQRTDLSFTLFLSDDYEGGELEFDYGHGKSSFKGQAGQMVIYPTGVLHQVTPVTQGTRLCLVGWINSLVPDAQDRETLFQFNQQLQHIKTQIEDPTLLNPLFYSYQYFLRKASY